MGRNSNTLNEILLDAEMAVNGGLLIFTDECRKAVEILSPDDFENEYSSTTFKIITDALKAGEKIDAAIFGSKEIDPQIKQYALTCASTFISTANYDAYITCVKNAARKRRIFTKMQEIIYSGEEANDAITEVERLIEAEKADNKPQQDEMKNRLVNYYENVYKPLDTAERIYTGFTRLDSVLNGLRKGSLSYVGAAPSTGKTSFGLNIVLHAIKAKRRVMFFSLEMSVEQLLDRLFANALSVSYDLIDQHRLEQDDKNRLAKSIDAILKLENLMIIDNVYALESMASKISQFKPDIVFVDFLQNIRTREKYSVRKAQVDYISSEFKRLARVNNCHICVLSQLNRVGEQGAPRMSDLKESGNLEADGDIIMLMHRPFVADKTDKYRPSDTAILIDKNKYGRTGKLKFSFDGHFQRFTEVEERYGA
jgi:replicative DNA helicase